MNPLSFALCCLLNGIYQLIFGMILSHLRGLKPRNNSHLPLFQLSKLFIRLTYLSYFTFQLLFLQTQPHTLLFPPVPLQTPPYLLFFPFNPRSLLILLQCHLVSLRFQPRFILLSRLLHVVHSVQYPLLQLTLPQLHFRPQFLPQTHVSHSLLL